MKTSILFSIPLFIIAVFTADTAQTKLRLDIPKGKTVKMSSAIHMDYYSDRSLSNKLMSMDMNLDNHYTVKDRLENGIHEIEYRISRLQLNQVMGTQTVSYDSDKPEEAGPMGSMIHEQFAEFIEKAIPFKVNSLGKVVEEPDLESASGSFDMKQITDQVFIDFPEESIEKGYTWSEESEVSTGNGSISVVSKYTVTAITKDKVSVQVTVEPTDIDVEGLKKDAMKMEQAGNIMFDKNTGQLLSLVMNQSMAVKDPNQGEIFVVSTTEIKSE